MEKKDFSDTILLAKLDAFLFLILGVAMFLQPTFSTISIYGFLIVLALISFAKGFVREVMGQQTLGWVSRLISVGYFSMVLLVGWVITTNRPGSLESNSLFLGKLYGVAVLYLILTVASKASTMIVQALNKETIGSSVFVALGLMVLTMISIDSYKTYFDSTMGIITGVLALLASFALFTSSISMNRKAELVY